MLADQPAGRRPRRASTGRRPGVRRRARRADRLRRLSRPDASRSRPSEQPAWVRGALRPALCPGGRRSAAASAAGDRSPSAARPRGGGARPAGEASASSAARPRSCRANDAQPSRCDEHADGSRPGTDDKLREECGVFGIFGNDEAAAHTVLGLHALQHRGQEAAGVVTFDGRLFHSHRALGLVGDHFSSEAVIAGLPGHAAIGHVRYSTQGAPLLRNVQPLFADFAFGGLALGHNGNLTNALTLRRAAGRAGLPVPVDLGHRGDHPSDRALAPADRGRAPGRRAAPGRGRLCAGRAVGQTRSMACAIRWACGRWCWASSTARRSWPPRPARSTSWAPASCATSSRARS